MNAAAEQVEERGNMIKRMNSAILNSLKRINLRSVGAVLLGGCAGLSLTSSIIPTVMATAGIGDSFSARWALGEYAVYSMMAWAVGGWAARRTGSGAGGAIVLGFVGGASGLLLTWFALGSAMNLLLAGGGAGLVYGAFGGLLIGSTLRGEKKTDADQES
jgi:hypothetical protein